MGTSHRLRHNSSVDRILERLVRLGHGNLIALEVAIDAKPMHFSAANHLLFTNDRYIVFRLTSDHTGIATRTLVQIDSHSPFVVRIYLGFRPKRNIFKMLLHSSSRESRIRFVLVQSPFAD